jgi:hypothetical protein
MKSSYFFLISILFPLSLSASVKIFVPDPFFVRFDRADIILKGEIVAIEQAAENIGSGDLKQFSKDHIEIARVKIENLYKGKATLGEIIPFYFLSTDIPEFKDLGYLTASLQKGDRLLIYSRRTDEKYLITTQYGFFPYSEQLEQTEVKAVIAAKENMPEGEVIKLLPLVDRQHYKRQIKKHGKFDRES